MNVPAEDRAQAKKQQMNTREARRNWLCLGEQADKHPAIPDRVGELPANQPTEQQTTNSQPIANTS